MNTAEFLDVIFSTFGHLIISTLLVLRKIHVHFDTSECQLNVTMCNLLNLICPKGLGLIKISRLSFPVIR